MFDKYKAGNVQVSRNVFIKSRIMIFPQGRNWLDDCGCEFAEEAIMVTFKEKISSGIRCSLWIALTDFVSNNSRPKSRKRPTSSLDFCQDVPPKNWKQYYYSYLIPESVSPDPKLWKAQDNSLLQIRENWTCFGWHVPSPRSMDQSSSYWLLYQPESVTRLQIWIQSA